MNDDSTGRNLPRSASGALPDPQFLGEFAKVIESWAKATTAGETEEAESAAMQAFSLACEEACKNPRPSLLLNQEANDLERKGDWSEAEAVRRKILVLEESTGDFGLIAKAQMDLSAFFRLLGRLDEASQFACAATASARRTNLFPLVVMALVCEVRCALERGDSAKALAAASEALGLIEAGKMYDPMRAKALTSRARCLVVQGRLTEAAPDLDSSWELLQATSGSWMMTMPGPIGARANWWEVKSQLESRKGNLGSAREAMTQAIDYHRRSDGPHALLTLARALERLGELSKAIGEVAEEARALNEAQAIRKDLRLPSKVGSRSDPPR